jgi:hypothetical protein
MITTARTQSWETFSERSTQEEEEEEEEEEEDTMLSYNLPDL